MFVWINRQNAESWIRSGLRTLFNCCLCGDSTGTCPGVQIPRTARLPCRAGKFNAARRKRVAAASRWIGTGGFFPDPCTAELPVCRCYVSTRPLGLTQDIRSAKFQWKPGFRSNSINWALPRRRPGRGQMGVLKSLGMRCAPGTSVKPTNWDSFTLASCCRAWSTISSHVSQSRSCGTSFCHDTQR